MLGFSRVSVTLFVFINTIKNYFCFFLFNKGKFILLSDKAIYRNNTHTQKLTVMKTFLVHFLCLTSRDSYTTVMMCVPRIFKQNNSTWKKLSFILQVCPRTAKLSVWSVKRFYYVCGLEQMDSCVTGMLFSNCTLQYVKIFHSHWMFFFPPRVCLEHLDLGPDRGMDRKERSWCLMDVKLVLLKSRCSWRILASVILQ